MTGKGEQSEQGTPLTAMMERLVCQECGAPLQEEDIRCPKCGTVIEEEDEVEESLKHWGDEIVYPEDVCEM